MELFQETVPLSDAARALLAIRLVPGIGARLTAALIERFGSAQNALEASVDDLANIPHLGIEIAQRLKRAWRDGDVDKEIEAMRRHQTHVLISGEPGYPSRLQEIPLPPPLIYVSGQILATDERAIALVGSRQCSSYGRRVAERLAADLAREGFTVVSGLARGIDASAHRGALNAGGRTLAVLAGGLSKIYPPEHADLAQEVRAAGALVSESAMLMEPMAGMFPARNRIISGLCRAVVIVEAAEKSGALITAQHAAEQGREVFAIPGPVDSPYSGGCLKLMRQGARLIRHAGDLLEDLDWQRTLKSTPAADARPAPEPPGLSEVEKKIWDMLREKTRTIDEIAQTVARPIAELSGILMGLELRNIVRRLPGSAYERV
jgi:DNA processing protein